MRYKVRMCLEKEVEADDEDEAVNKCWEEIEEENDRENMTTINRLTDSARVTKV